MPWKKTGGASASMPLTVISETWNSIVVERGTPPSGILTAWDLYVREVGAPTWDLVASDLTGATQTIADLDSDKDYEVRAVPHVTFAGETKLTGRTRTRPSRILQRKSVLLAAPQNAMFQDIEPVESQYGAPVISGPGVTLGYNVARLLTSANVAQHTVYGLRFLLGNMTTSPISGGRLIVARNLQWNGSWEPRIANVMYNTITDDVMFGWERATIDGDPLLPIHAGEPGISGHVLATRWTDWIITGNGIPLNTTSLDFLTRFLLPPRSVAPYALTNGAWGTQGYQRMGVTAARARFKYYWRSTEGAPKESHYRAEGDFVTDPATAGPVINSFGTCPGAANPFTNGYGFPGPTHTPLLGIQYATSPEEVL